MGCSQRPGCAQTGQGSIGQSWANLNHLAIKLIWEALLGLNGSQGYKGRGLAQHQHTQKPWLILAENPDDNLCSYLVGQVQSYSKFSCSSTLYIVSPEPWRNGERHPSKLKQ